MIYVLKIFSAAYTSFYPVRLKLELEAMSQLDVDNWPNIDRPDSIRIHLNFTDKGDRQIRPEIACTTITICVTSK